MSMKSTIKAASDKVAEVFSAKPDKAGDMDILDKLHMEHDEVQEMLEKIVDSRKTAERKTLLAKIRKALIPHTKAEQSVVYDAIIAVKNEKNKIDGAEGYVEHELVDRTLAKLSKIRNLTSPEFTATAKVLKELIEHHVKEEERNIWADVREKFDAKARIAMNRRFEAAKKKVRVA